MLARLSCLYREKILENNILCENDKKEYERFSLLLVKLIYVLVWVKCRAQPMLTKKSKYTVSLYEITNIV